MFPSCRSAVRALCFNVFKCKVAMIKNISPAYIPADIFSNFAYLECVRRQPALLCYAFIMRRFIVSLLYISVMAVLASCGDGGAARGVLSRADSLMEEHTDSAMALLRRDSVMLVHAPKPQRMAYILSRTEAEDKLYITHRSDSAMQLAVKYFDRHGTALQRTRAWYLLGRVYCDMLLYGNALTAFDAAIAVQPDDDSTVCRYKARACSWAGSVYEEKNLHKDALRYNKMAYAYACKADVPTVLVYSLRDIGRSYWAMDKTHEAIPYYLHAAGKADSLNNGYLYNMVMEELASIYIESKMLDSARWALFAFNSKIFDADLAPHYFVLADYYELKGDLDSAIICNKEGLKYGGHESTMTVSLDLARLLERVGKHEEAEKYYAVYSQYKDSVEADRVVQNNNLLGFVEKNITVERQNASLAEDKTRLVTLVLFIVVVVAVAAVLGMRFYNKRKIMYERQQERVRRYWSIQHETDISNIRKNEERIETLENELSLAGKKLTEMQKKLLEAEVDMLDKRNEQLLSEQRHRDMLVAELESSEIYKKYCKQGMKSDNDDFLHLKEILNVTYDRFTFRLEELYPEIRYDELYICCLTKIKLASKEICAILDFRANKVSMTKTRLYKKIFKTKGSVADFDCFIRNF